MNWDKVLYNVSNELQMETKDYLPQLNDITEGMASQAENGRYLANSAHKMLLELAPEGFEDYKIQSIDYEKTLDTNAMPHNFFCVYGNKIANYVSDKVHNFGKPKEEQATVEDDGKFHPFRALKQTVSDLVLKFSYATAVNRVQTEYKNNGQEISYEQAKQIYDAKETSTSKDYNSRFNQTVATLGVSTENTESTGPELQND